MAGNAPRSPGDFSPAPERGIAYPFFRATQQAPSNPSETSKVNLLLDPLGEGFANVDIALFDSLAQPASQAPGSSGNSLDVAPLASPAGADPGQQPSAAPAAALIDRGSRGSSGALPLVATNAQPDVAALTLMLGAGPATPGQPGPVAGIGHGGSSGSGGPLVSRRHHGRPSDKNGDPVWLLDAYDRLALPDTSVTPAGYQINTYAGWPMNLMAQVSGATVQSYTWALGGNPTDFTNIAYNGYNVQFTWASFSGSNHSDTVILTTTNVGGGGERLTFNFNVISTSNKGNQGSRPTGVPSFPLLVPPDAVKPGQEMIRQQYYSLGEETGEVRTNFTMPGYNPGIAPLQLDYSSLAANPEPIFTEYYQLGSLVPTTLTASLYWNCSNGCTGQMPVASTSYDTSGTLDSTNTLNPGDILDIALQYAPQSPLSTGRYPYEIHVNDGGNTVVTPGTVDILNQSGSVFGAGWSLDDMEQIFSVSGGVILAMPYGQSLWFASGGNCGGTGVTSYVRPAGDFSCLVQNSDQSYTLTSKSQVKTNFNSSGYQTSIVEPTTNNTFSFGYDGSNRPQWIEDFEGRYYTFSYTGGFVTSITDAANRVATLGYTGSNLTSITGPDPLNSELIPSFHYTYDNYGDLLALTDPRSDLPNNDLFTFAYNGSSGRIQTVTRPDTLPGGAHTSESLYAQQLNGLGGSATVLAVEAAADYMDPRSTPNSNPPNPIDWYVATDWFGFGYGLQYYDPLYDITTARRDANGLTWLEEDPLSRPTRTFYDQSGKITLPAPQGDPTEIVLPDGNTVSLYTYNYYNEPTLYVDPDGNTTTYGYGGTDGTPSTGDLLNDIQCPCNIIFGPNPGEFQQSWNAHGFKHTFSDPNGNIVTMAYGTYDRLTGIQYPPDATGGTVPTVAMTYNNAGDALSYQDALAYTTSYMPDSLGRVLNDVAPTGGEISYTYDAAGNVTKIQDPVQNATSYHYDPMNRVDWMAAPGPLTTNYTYDADGNITDIADADILPDNNHRDRHFIYDNAGRLTTEQWLDGATVTYQANYRYDAASELTSASDQTGAGVTISAYTFSYDARGRLASTQQNNSTGLATVTLSVTLSDQYDANGNRTILSDNLTPAGTIAYYYYPGDLLGLIQMQAAGASDFLQVTFGYDSQDPADRLTSIQRSATVSNWANTTIGYTNRNLVGSIQDSYPSGSASFGYTYDLDGQVHTYSGPDGAMSYGYDPTGQLTIVYGSHPETYAYDLNGNRQSANGHTYGSPGPANELTSDGVYSYTYDNVGNMLTKTGLEGGITTAYSFTWDYQNRLERVKKTQNSGTTVLADDTFTYDVFGRRIGKMEMDGSQIWTVYDGANPYADFTGTTSLALKTRYLYGNGVDRLLASTDASGNNTVWYLTDLLGSVRVASGVVGDPGHIGQVTVSYDSFGNIISGTPYDRFAYTGREQDSEIGLYYYRARYYDPATGRFTTQDPAGYSAGDPNLYRYVYNGPTDAIDPSGMIDQGTTKPPPVKFRGDIIPIEPEAPRRPIIIPIPPLTPNPNGPPLISHDELNPPPSGPRLFDNPLPSPFGGELRFDPFSKNPSFHLRYVDPRGCIEFQFGGPDYTDILRKLYPGFGKFFK